MWSQNQLLWQQQQWAAAAAASAMQQQAPAQGPPSSAVLAPVPVAATESKQEDTDKAKASGRSSKHFVANCFLERIVDAYMCSLMKNISCLNST